MKDKSCGSDGASRSGMPKAGMEDLSKCRSSMCLGSAVNDIPTAKSAGHWQTNAGSGTGAMRGAIKGALK